ncbi:MAG: hypothetical protein ABI175_00470 [Polyangiales bacterium]
MPRKQRFKPSRKPKMDAPQGEPHSIPSDSGGADGQIEPHREENRGVIEAVGESA